MQHDGVSLAHPGELELLTRPSVARGQQLSARELRPGELERDACTLDRRVGLALARLGGAHTSVGLGSRACIEQRRGAASGRMRARTIPGST